jgi:mercuric reductase
VIVDLAIDGMTCLDCARHITVALGGVEGVASAHVDYRAGRAHVTLDPGVVPTSRLTDALAAAVEHVGYRAESLAGPPILPESVPAAEPAPAMAASVGLVGPTPVAANLPGTGGSDTPSFASEPPVHRSLGAAGASGPERIGTDPRANFDLFIIGTGGAGVAAAIQAAGMGAKVAIVESGTLGGTCVNVGCIPSKTLMEAAAHVHAARKGFPGVAPCAPAVDWGEVVRQKNTLVNELRDAKYADVLASYPGVVRLEGRARLLPAHGMVRIQVQEGANAREYTARKVIVATGAVAALPPIPGIKTVDALTSTTAMDLPVLPPSLIVLGGGQVGVELGQMFARFGVKVVIVQRAPQLLPGEDSEIAAVLRDALEAEGIEVHTGTVAVRVEQSGTETVVHVRQGALEGQLRAARVLVAAGRRPNTRELGLDDLGVARTPSGYIQTDATLRTSHADVYAAGDVTGGPGYVYVAAAGGRVAAENALKALHGTGTVNDEPLDTTWT